MKKAPYRLYLSEEEIPKKWYNLRADMKELPEPMINPVTMKPVICFKIINLNRSF